MRNDQQSNSKLTSHKHLVYDKEPVENATSSFSVLSFSPALTWVLSKI